MQFNHEFWMNHVKTSAGKQINHVTWRRENPGKLSSKEAIKPRGYTYRNETKGGNLTVYWVFRNRKIRDGNI